MAQTGWTEELASGSADLDSQHREFFDALARFEAEPATQASTGALVAFLVEHTREHFKLEESYMAVYRYPQRDAHRAAHRAITTRLLVLRARLQSEPFTPAFVEATRELVNVWLRDQITHHDRALIAFLQAQPAAEPKAEAT